MSYLGELCGVIKGDTRSLGYRSCHPLYSSKWQSFFFVVAKTLSLCASGALIAGLEQPQPNRTANCLGCSFMF